jgi:DNA modification methylase
MKDSIIIGDAVSVLSTIPEASARTCVTSPPYWGLRDYGEDAQIGLEETPDEYVDKLVAVFREVRRVLTNDGTLWLNLGDSYNAAGRTGHGTRVGYKQGTNRASAAKADACRPSAPDLKEKDLVGIPWAVAFALRRDGWYLRSDIIWAKPNPMPESVNDRPTKSHEYIFLLSKSPSYYYDSGAVAEPLGERSLARLRHVVKSGEEFDPAKHKGEVGLQNPMEVLTRSAAAMLERGKRNRRTIWTVPVGRCNEAHFATFPPRLIEPCILAGSAVGDTVLDPFMGSGTTAMVAKQHGRHFIGVELNPEYAAIAERRVDDTTYPLTHFQGGRR